MDEKILPGVRHIAKCLVLAAGVNEASYEKNSDTIDVGGLRMNVPGRYTISAMEAAEAIDPEVAMLVGPALYSAWNDVLDWANSQFTTEELDRLQAIAAGGLPGAQASAAGGQEGS